MSVWCSALLLAALLSVAAGASEQAPSAIIGKATSIAGEPVANVKVTATEFEVGRPGQTWEAKTSVQGTFRITLPATPGRQVSLRVEGPPDGKLAPCALAPQDMLFLRAGETVRVTILLAPATAKLSGTVSDPDHKPVAGATVTINAGRTMRSLSRSVTTDAEGRYEIAGLAQGSYIVQSVEPPPGSALIRLSTWKPFGVRVVNLGDGQTGAEDFVLPWGARLVGRVLGENGKPVPGAVVSCSLDAATEEGPKQVYQMAGQWYSGDAKTDAEGGYSIGGLTQETYVVEARPPEGADLAPATLRGVNAPKAGDVKLQTLVLYKAGTILGRVLGADGKPVADAEVVLPGPGRFGAPVTVKADAAGKFTLRGLGTGRYAITIKPPQGSSSCETKFDDLTAVRGLSVERIFKLMEGVRVVGTVTDPEGKPVRGATIYAHYGYGSSGKAMTNDRGRFLIQGIAPPTGPQPPQKYQPQNEVSAVPPDEAPTLKSGTATLPVAPAGGSANVDIRLAHGVAIKGRVTDPDGRPVSGCEVSVSQFSGRGALLGFGTVRTEADGCFRFMHLAAGRMFLNVQTPEDSPLAGKLTPEQDFEAGKTTTVDVVLEPGATVAGKAVTSRGKAAVGAQVTLQPKSGWPLTKARSAFVGPDGTFRIESVAPGTYEARCSPLDPVLIAAPMTLNVAPRGESKLEIVLHVTGSVSGTLRDGDGKPLGQGMAYLQLQPAAQPQGAGGYGHPDDQGRYRIAGLVPGKYNVIVNVGPRGQAKGLTAPPPAEIVVEEGKETKCDVKVPAKGGGPPRKAEF